jgi:hypothetical protein
MSIKVIPTKGEHGETALSDRARMGYKRTGQPMWGFRCPEKPRNAEIMAVRGKSEDSTGHYKIIRVS